jgi:hypothetical protein
MSLLQRLLWLDRAGAAWLQHAFLLGRSRLGCSRSSCYPCEHPTRTHDGHEGNARTRAQKPRLCLTTPRRVHVQGECAGSAARRIRVAAFWVARVAVAIVGLASGGRRAPTRTLVDNANVVGGAFVAAQRAPRKGPSCTDGSGRFGQCMRCTAVGTEHLRTWATVSLGMSAIAMSAPTLSVEMLARSCRPY